MGCRGFCATLWLLVLGVLQKKLGVRISTIFFAPTGRTPGGVGLTALGLLRHKKGGVDDLKKMRSIFYRLILRAKPYAVGGPLLGRGQGKMQFSDYQSQ